MTDRRHKRIKLKFPKFVSDLLAPGVGYLSLQEQYTFCTFLKQVSKKTQKLFAPYTKAKQLAFSPEHKKVKPFWG